MIRINAIPLSMKMGEGEKKVFMVALVTQCKIKMPQRHGRHKVPQKILLIISNGKNLTHIPTIATTHYLLLTTHFFFNDDAITPTQCPN